MTFLEIGLKDHSNIYFNIFYTLENFLSFNKSFLISILNFQKEIDKIILFEEGEIIYGKFIIKIIF